MATKKTEPEPLTFHLGGKSYAIEDFSIGDLEWLETEMGCSLEEIDFGSMKAIVRIVCLIKRQDDPKYTLEQARKEKLTLFDESNGNGSRPTQAREGRANGRQTSQSSASGRGR